MATPATYCGTCGARLVNGVCAYCGDGGFEPDGVAGMVKRVGFRIRRFCTPVSRESIGLGTVGAPRFTHDADSARLSTASAPL